MGRNFSWTASVGGKQVADGTVAGRDSHTPDRVKGDAALAVSLEAGVSPRDVTVNVTETKSNRQVVAELRAKQGR
ncbi:hypothetical protein [Streptomyces sp. NPDC093223]|uniref:hypothetical protein n=1 Tax=Streptomyces sp. NPDC093223 TaxID=3366033 RepID=UPI00382D7FAA